MTLNGIHGNCPSPSSREPPSSCPQSPAPLGVGQASPQGTAGPIPPPSFCLGRAAVNELHGDPGAPCTQGMCPEVGLELGEIVWGRETERAEKGGKKMEVERLRE